MSAPLSFVLGVVLKATLLLLAAGAASLALHRRGAAARHLVWTLAVCGLLALPLFSVTLPGWRLGFVTLGSPEADVAAAPMVANLPAASIVPLADVADGGFAELPAPPALPEMGSVTSTSETPALAGSVGREIEPALLIPAIYLLVMLALFARMVVGRVSVRRLARQAAVVTDAGWTGLVRDLAWILSIDRPVVLLRGGHATMPMTWGVRRPTILLPAEADTWTEERRRVVLLHELAHVARHDCLTQTLAAVACALYWFHPGAWHAARRLRVERELACDDRVLAAGTRAREYAAHLLEVARAFRAPALAGSAAVSMARPSHLEGRLLAVLDGVRNRSGISRRGAALSAAAAVVLVLPLAAMRPGEARAATAAASLPAAIVARHAPQQAARGGSACTLVRGTRLNCEVEARAGERLTLQMPSGVSARVVGRDQGGVRVRVEGGRSLSVRAERAAGGVRVAVTSVSGRDRTEPDLVIEVPRRFDVQASADGGGLEIRDVRGAFTGHTRGGGLALIRVEGTLRMDAGGGGAYIQDTRLDGRLEMHGGGVLMGGNRGNLDVRGAGATVVGRPGELRGWSDRLRSQTDRWNQQQQGEAASDAAADAGDEGAAARAAERDRDAAADANDRPIAIAQPGGPIDIRYAPDGANLWTGGGDIRVGRANGRVLAHTGGGNVTVQSVNGAARVSTGAGNVSVSVAGQGGDVQITSGRGSVTLVLPADFSGSLEVESAYTQGNAPTRVVSDFPLATTRTQAWDTRHGSPRRYVRGRGTLGSGRHRVNVAAVNGDVRVVRAGRGGEPVSVRIDGGDVTCQGEGCTVRLNDGAGVVRTTSTGTQYTRAAAGSAPATWRATGEAGDTITLVTATGGGYAYATGDADGRIASIRAMARYAPADAAAQGIASLALGDADPRVQRAAVDALAGLRGTARDQQLRRIVREHRSGEIRQRATAALR
ncbi:MAG TPA: M56 family metallopeptidase [Longimicrobium sp.]|nr:M56 family metallopeptidase [Longimicrobium sp.]